MADRIPFTLYVAILIDIADFFGKELNLCTANNFPTPIFYIFHGSSSE